MPRRLRSLPAPPLLVPEADRRGQISISKGVPEEYRFSVAVHELAHRLQASEGKAYKLGYASDGGYAVNPMEIDANLNMVLAALDRGTSFCLMRKEAVAMLLTYRPEYSYANISGEELRKLSAIVGAMPGVRQAYDSIESSEGAMRRFFEAD